MPTTTRATIRPMLARDLDRVCAIECAVFPAPWSRTAFENELADDREAFPWVIEQKGEVVGYLIAWLLRGELHIGNIAVAPAARRRGLGSSLLVHCLREASARGATLASLEVRVSNERAIALYENHGFEGVAIRRGYYSDNGEDALVMLRLFTSDEET